MSELPSLNQEYGQADLEREMAEHKAFYLEKGDSLRDLTEKEWKQHFLNNFFSQMPGGFSRSTIDQLSKLYSQEEIEADAELRETMKLYPRMFADVDRIIEKLGLDKDQLAAWTKSPGGLSEKTPDEFLDALFKIYIELRKLGYQHQKLQS